MQMTGNSSQEISLYFHIPFCTRKCHYCHFYVLPDKEQSKIELLEGFKLEWKRWLPSIQDKTISTIYFGGGTPFLFGASRINEILSLIKSSCSFTSSDIEITLEANPENVTLSKMRDYKEAGINRVSLGIQTLDNSLLKSLGRLHKAENAIEAVHLTSAAGIKDISIDLMYDLPHQTLEHFENTLQVIRTLPITHFSLYNLTIEPHTIFFKQKEILSKFLPNETTSLKMYQRAIELLEEQGLTQYEISAFCQPGYHSKHNVGYWTARPFLGFGPSAFSYWNKKRFHNVSNLKKYCEHLYANESPIDFEEQLDEVAAIRELLVIQMRLKKGVNLTEFQSKHGNIDQESIETIKNLQNEGFLNIHADIITLTQRGILFYDTVASELI